MNTIRDMIFDVSTMGQVVVLFILFIVLGITYMAKIDKENDYNIKFTIWQKILLRIMIIVTVITICTYLVAIYSIVNEPYDYQEDKPANNIEYLAGLNDNMGIRGKYYITRGFVESDMYYNYMVDCGSYMKQNQLNTITNDIRIITSSTEKPRIEWRTKRKTYGPFYEEDKYWNIYVPEGAINDTISIDMK